MSIAATLQFRFRQTDGDGTVGNIDIDDITGFDQADGSAPQRLLVIRDQCTVPEEPPEKRPSVIKAHTFPR